MSRTKQIITPLLFLFAIYPITLSGIVGEILQLILYATLMLYVLYKRKVLVELLDSLTIFKIIGILCILAFITIICPIIFGTLDFSYFSQKIKYIFLALIRLIALTIFYREEFINNKFFFISNFVKAICVMIVTTVIFLIIPELKEMWLLIFEIPEYSRNLLKAPQYITRFSIIGFSGYPATFLCTVGVVFELFLMLNVKAKLSNYCFLLLCLVGNMFYGRTGLVVSLFCILIMLIPLFIHNKKIFRNIILFLVSIGIILFIAYCISSKVRVWMNWSFELFLNVLFDKNLSTASTTQLMSMFDVDMSFKTLIIGDARYVLNGEYYKNVDIGIFRQIFFYGLFGVTVAYSTVLYSIRCIYQLLKEYKLVGLLFHIVTILLVLIMFEIKGECYFMLFPLLIIYIFNMQLHKRNAN